MCKEREKDWEDLEISNICIFERVKTIKFYIKEYVHFGVLNIKII